MPPHLLPASNEGSAPKPPLSDAVSTFEQEAWDNEGGHMSCGAGRASYTPGAALPYQAVMTRPHGVPLYQSFATMREEAFIRRNTSIPARTLSPRYHRPAS